MGASETFEGCQSTVVGAFVFRFSGSLLTLVSPTPSRAGGSGLDDARNVTVDTGHAVGLVDEGELLASV